VVAVLEDAQEVTEIARRGDAFLVLFANPDDSSRMLAGWI
jgi:hypothetical protein